MLYQVFCVFKSWPSKTLILAVKEIKTQIIFYAVQRSYRSSYTNNCCCSLYSDVATLDCCCQPAKQWEIKFTLEFFQTHTHTQNKKNSQQRIMCYVCINIYGGWEEGQKTTSALHDISWQANKSWIPKLWPSLFHIHLKARVAVCAPLSTSPPPSPADSWVWRIDCISGSNTSLCKMTLSLSKSAENPGSGAEHAVRMECRKSAQFFFSCQTPVRWI